MYVLKNAALGGAIALALNAMPAYAAKAPLPGYGPDKAATAGALPVHVVIEQPRVKPQIAYGYVAVPDGIAYGASAYGNYPGMSMGQSIGVDVAGGLIASLIINGAEYAGAKHFAQGPYQVMQDAHCDLPLGDAFRTPVVNAIQARWSTAAVQPHVLEDGQSFNKAVGTGPRYVFAVSSSLAPDFSALITTIDAEAYPDLQPGSKRTPREPAWRDTLIIVSDRMLLPAKTQADTDALAAPATSRYAALNLEPLIAKVNAQRGMADPRDRRKITNAQSDLRSALKEAQRPDWTPAGEAMRRAQLWSAGDCAALSGAVATNAAQSGLAVAALLDGTLPARVADNAALPVETAGERKLVALPGGIVVSRKGGDEVVLGFRRSVLAD